MDGAEQGDVYVEAALDEETFDQTAVAKYTLQLEQKWAKSEALGNDDDFSLTLSLDHLYTNETVFNREYT